MNDPDTRERVVLDAQAQLDGWYRRFHFLKEFAKEVKAIEEGRAEREARQKARRKKAAAGRSTAAVR